MRGGSPLSLLALAALAALLLAGCGGGKATISTTTVSTTSPSAAPTTANTPPVAAGSIVPVVPVHTQRAIRRRAPDYAFVPTNRLARYRYYQWTIQKPAAGQQFVVIFFRRSGWPDYSFTAGTKQYTCRGGTATGSAQAATVHWSGNNENDQYAWICVTDSSGRLVQLVVDAAPLQKGGPSVASLGAILRSSRPIR